MDVGESSAEFWLNIAQMGVQDSSSRSWQGETIHSSKVVEDSIYLFGQFVSIISPDALENSRPRLELSTFVRDLCVKAPSVAQYLVQEILNHSRDDSQPEVQGPKELATTTKRPSKRRKKLDPSYRCPSQIQPDIPRERQPDLHEASSVYSQDGDEFVTCQSEHNDMRNDSLVTENC